MQYILAKLVMTLGLPLNFGETAVDRVGVIGK